MLVAGWIIRCSVEGEGMLVDFCRRVVTLVSHRMLEGVVTLDRLHVGHGGHRSRRGVLVPRRILSATQRVS